MADRAHLSIGDVLNALRDEFPDITISKIRFLESQGLVNPERTPSGYRKFYPEDVDRLRWILVQQKDHFLPLKVIRERLAQRDLETEAHAPPPGRPKRRAAKKKVPVQPTLTDLDSIDAVLEDDGPDDLAVDHGGVSLSKAELAQASGLTNAQLVDLEAYGLIAPAASFDNSVFYDESALTIARAARGFLEVGLDGRHLRMYKQFVDREAGLFEQVLIAELRKRNPEARARAREQFEELAKFGRQLRAAYLRQALADALGE